MEFKHGEVGTTHLAGRFGMPRELKNEYFFTCFITDFCYWQAGKMVQAKAGSCIVHTPGSRVYHGPTKQMSTGFVNDWFFAGGEDIAALLQIYPVPLNQHFEVGDPYFLRWGLQKMIEEQQQKQPGYQEKIKALFTQTVIDLHRAAIYGDLQQAKKGGVYAARDAMQKQPDQKWTIALLAQKAGYSTSRFCALYKAAFGLAPMEDLAEIRLSLAKRLLRYSDYGIKEVAARCGFGSVAYFSNFFKQKTGVAPSQFGL